MNISATKERLVSVDFQADGKIVATGSAENDTDYDCLLIRLNSDGTHIRVSPAMVF